MPKQEHLYYLIIWQFQDRSLRFSHLWHIPCRVTTFFSWIVIYTRYSASTKKKSRQEIRGITKKKLKKLAPCIHEVDGLIRSPCILRCRNNTSTILRSGRHGPFALKTFHLCTSETYFPNIPCYLSIPGTSHFSPYPLTTNHQNREASATWKRSHTMRRLSFRQVFALWIA